MPHPLVCDLTGSGEAPGDRFEEYRLLFDSALIERLRTDHGIRFRFRADALDEERLRDLAARERACCPFFDIEVRRAHDELWWDTAVTDPEAGFVLDEFYRLPEHLLEADALPNRMRERGLVIVADRQDPPTAEAKLDHS
jgi:hypothetical protein